jgi:hypothetical protein
MSDYMGNFSSWLKRQSVTLIVGIDDVTIVGWVMTERWNQNAKDGRSVHVLRGIEVFLLSHVKVSAKPYFC